MTSIKPSNVMATKSPFDPDQADPEFYSKNPQQHGDSDFGRESEGVGTNVYKDSTSGMDMETSNRNETVAAREQNAGVGGADSVLAGESFDSGTQQWDVNPETIEAGQKGGKMMSDEAAKKLDEIPQNPSDEALFGRADATYLKPDDKPNEGYDPHHKGYDSSKKES